MFELTIEGEFCAAHAIVIRGEREPVHGHNWHVTITVAGERLDEDGLLCDFHPIEASLREVIGRFNNRNLNETAPFDRINPTAERIAQHIGETVAKTLPAGVRMVSCRVTEAPGCAAVWRA
jgi:6-pyruvoyltetrahydropterin/6-carboxytetrahydropterin synthase